MKQFRFKYLLKKGIFLLLFIIAVNPAFASEPPEPGSHYPQEEQESKFNAGKFIINHLIDSYSWHILSMGDFHFNVPLPVILYSEEKGLVFFMSSKFEHGHAQYNGFHIEHEGENKGRIVETLHSGSTVVPLDFSITKNVTAVFVSIFIMLIVFLGMAKKYRKNGVKAPSGLQNAMELLILYIRDDVVIPSIGKDKYEKYMPFLLSIFFFILLNNLMGLIPIFPAGVNVTGNITITCVLALFTFVTVSINGNKDYWKHIFNPPGIPLVLKHVIPLMPIIEFTGIFIKPFVLMVRLFANMAAGHIVALGFFSLIFIFSNMSIYAGYGISIVSVLFTVFMSFLELMVAFIQAYVFTMLSAIYIGMAIEEPHH